MNRKFGRLLVGLAMFVGSGGDLAFGQNHNYINTMRSSALSHVFVSQSVEGEFGGYKVTGSESGSDGSTNSVTEHETWQGFGIGTTIGLEVMKFIQFTAGHTFVNVRNKEKALEKIDGSRLHLGGRLVFQAPLANLEIGGGMLGARLDYQKDLENATFYGSGMFYSLGLNYFMTSQVSFFGVAKFNHENLIRNGGSSVTESIVTDSTLFGLGFSLWL